MRACSGPRAPTRWMRTRCRRWRPGCPRATTPVPWTRCRRTSSNRGTSRSAVSRRFVALSRRKKDEFLSRALGELDIAVVFVDAKFFHEHCVLIALGVDSQGIKQVLGLRQGATENATVTRALLADLVERGLCTHRRVLFVIDGAKALRPGRLPRSTGNARWCSAAKCTSDAMSSPICPSIATHKSRAACTRPTRATPPSSGERRLRNRRPVFAARPPRRRPHRYAKDSRNPSASLDWAWLAPCTACCCSTNAIEDLNGSVEPLRPKRQTLAWWGDGSTLGQCRPARRRTSLQTRARIP